ncbi:MAG: WD40/YVTN/BNR-like repeat-containing protein, partial [Terriglobales bacterium]
GEASIRSDISFGNGMYKSSDAGKTWEHIGLDDTRHIGRVLVDPHNPDVVFVAALGHAYGPNQMRGVFRSTDGGRTWSKVLYKDENTGAIDLAFDPQDSHIVYATLWNAHRPPWSTYAPVQGPGSGLYKSMDGGATWKQITGNGLPTNDWGRAGIATVKNTVYLIVDVLKGEGGGLYRSDDRGATWRQVSKDLRLFSRQWYFGEVTTDPSNPDVVYLPAVSLYKSSDGGKTFSALKGAPGGDDYHFLWVDRNDGRRMAVASDQGTVISVDGGNTWSSWFNQPTAQMYHVTTDNQFPNYYVYGAQQDSGTVATASRSDYGSITYREWYSVGAGESGYIVPDPSDPNIVIGGDTYGRLMRFDTRTGESQDISPTAVAVFGTDINQLPLRFTWTSPVVFLPQKPHAILMGAQFVLRSDDEGHSWHKISPDLTGCSTNVGQPPSAGTQETTAGGGRPTAGALTNENTVERCYGVVYTIAPSPVEEGVIWAGTDTGRIHVTRDGGKSWRDVTPKGLGDWSKISMIEASPHDPGTAYAAVDRHRVDDFTPHIWRTHDFGATWQEIDAGLPGGTANGRVDLYAGAVPAYAHAVREDPKRKGLLYAATEEGVYVSFHDGDRWLPLSLNLPTTPVHDLVVHDNDLVIATHGRSFWILDDVEPLREIAAQTASAPVTLFRPETAYRLRSDEQHDTPLPPETPMGENPPSGAILDFYLAQAAPEVAIEIRDSAGNMVRRYSSRDQQPAHPPTTFPDYWFAKEPVLSGNAGHHRWLWNLRYAAPPSLELSYDLNAAYGVPLDGLPRGPIALPGKYEVRLIAGGQTYTQTLTLAPDPRVKATPADLGQQHYLEMQIMDAMQRAWNGLQQARAAKNTQFAGGPGAARGRDSFTSLLSSFGNLLNVVDSADAAPTDQAQAAYRDLKQRLDTLLANWKQTQQH